MVGLPIVHEAARKGDRGRTVDPRSGHAQTALISATSTISPLLKRLVQKELSF